MQRSHIVASISQGRATRDEQYSPATKLHHPLLRTAPPGSGDLAPLDLLAMRMVHGGDKLLLMCHVWADGS
jgi:hypothetical protein